MTSFVAHRRLLHPADAKLLRVSMTYVLPGLAVFYVVLSGLWLLPDPFLGMYGNHDGHWASWTPAASWSGADFWISVRYPAHRHRVAVSAQFAVAQPGALALAMPAPLRSALLNAGVLGGVVGVALFALSPPRVFAGAVLPRDDLVYLSVLSPFSGYTLALPWYTLAPFNAHLIAAMNVATIALIRVGYERVLQALFRVPCGPVSRFASAPVTFVTYVPVYATLWLTLLIPFQAQRPCCGDGAPSHPLLALALIGARFIWLRWP